MSKFSLHKVRQNPGVRRRELHSFGSFIGGALTGLFALMGGFRLRPPFDDLPEAMVVIVPVSVPVVAGVWHRSWKVTVLLGAALSVVGLCFVGCTVMEMMLFAGRWAE